MLRLIVVISFMTLACTDPHTDSSIVQENSKHLPVTQVVTAPLSTDSAVMFIRKTFQEINSATANFQRREFKWEAENCNGDATATYYLTPNQEIVKVVETGIIGDSYWETAYYYKTGHFLFSLETNIGGPAIGPADTFTVRKYVYGDKVIRTVRNIQYNTPIDSVLTPTSKEYKILEAYKSKDFKTAFVSKSIFFVCTLCDYFTL